MMRENSETLELYKKLLVQKIILPGIDGDGKNSLEQIEKKKFQYFGKMRKRI